MSLGRIDITEHINNFTVLQSDIEYPVNSHTDTAHSGNATGFYKISAQLK